MLTRVFLQCRHFHIPHESMYVLPFIFDIRGLSLWIFFFSLSEALSNESYYITNSYSKYTRLTGKLMSFSHSSRPFI